MDISWFQKGGQIGLLREVFSVQIKMTVCIISAFPHLNKENILGCRKLGDLSFCGFLFEKSLFR